jgi:hypothetical protein
VKKWRKNIILLIGILLLLVSFVIFGTRILKTIIPVGSTSQQIAHITQEYGLDRPVYVQYGWFLLFFLSGLVLLGIHATVAIRRIDFQHWMMTKLFIIILLITNTITMLTYLVTAHVSIADSLPAFWLAMIVAGLALAGFVFLLIIWNGFKWGVWAFGISSFMLCTLKFVGHVPIIPVLFEASAVVILIYMLRKSWPEME